MSPRSTRLTGISGSWTSASAASSRSFMSGRRRVGLAELVELLLEHRDHLVVARPAGAPAQKDVVPAAGVVEVPALRLGVEAGGEGVVEREDLARFHACELRRVAAGRDVADLVSRDLDPELLTVGDDGGEPPLAQLVVGQALQTVVELG